MSDQLDRERLKKERPIHQRLWDLVRQQRVELHDADLISDDEYTELAVDYPAVERLETYDALRAENERLEGELAEARKERDNSLSSDFAAVWKAYADAPDDTLTADAVQLKRNLIKAVQESQWFDQARKRRETLAALLNAASGWIQCTDNCSIHNGRECDCGAADVLAKAESALASEQEGKP